MGKKRDRREQQESDSEEIDPELEKEMAALKAMQREKQRRKTSRGESREEIDDEEEDEDDEEEENGEQEESNSKFKYNKEALLRCAETLETAGLPFQETLQICDFPIDISDEHDDLQREMTFYNQTLLSVRVGKDRMQKLGIQTKRPNDYFCEHLKSDNHMAKIKDRLILEEKKIDAFEKRKNREHQKKFNKQVMERKKETDAKRRKEGIEEFDGGSSRGRKIDRSSDSDTPGKGKKRLAMDRKYGKGEKNMKRGSRKTLDDFSSYNPKGGSLNRRPTAKGAGGKGGGGGRVKVKAKVNRPGKANRQKHRASRSA